MMLMQKIQQLLSEKKEFKLVIQVSTAQNWREYFISDNPYSSNDIVEVGDNYVIIAKQKQQLLLPEWRISAIILT
ncbi:hypothetical protein [Pseudolactococcus reticulitermitis]|uniref:Uncharacterized protein n=1 Tax=Pseudolactococcus reticulitermitis TaxID=2025039 RepID=A0A224X7D5_9LACT|nr:hypothetical protein [Lactococcus reticulitermitis]GAX48426.1 hypothetical protein RsY01_2049 [Lactococcus reticulitermitis]